MARTDTKKNVLDFLSKLISAGLLSLLFSGCFWVYNNLLVVPILKYNDNTGEFTVQADFRGISMRIYPQMLICVDNTVFQVTHLSGYFEHEMIYFQERQASVERINQEYENKLLSYIKIGIINELETTLGEESAEKINHRLNIYVSFIGGVQYQVPYGNEIKKYCIIERSGLLTDYGTNVKQIRERLFESELTLYEDSDMIAMDQQVAEIIRVSAAEIGRWYGDNSQSF